MSAATAAAIAAAYDLGDPVADPVYATRGEQGLIWRLDTRRGSWAVKELLLPMDEAAAGRDVAFQLAAAAAGIPLPPPRRTRDGRVAAARARGGVGAQRARVSVGRPGPRAGRDRDRDRRRHRPAASAAAPRSAAGGGLVQRADRVCRLGGHARGGPPRPGLVGRGAGPVAARADRPGRRRDPAGPGADDHLPPRPERRERAVRGGRRGRGPGLGELRPGPARAGAGRDRGRHRHGRDAARRPGRVRVLPGHRGPGPGDLGSRLCLGRRHPGPPAAVLQPARPRPRRHSGQPGPGPPAARSHDPPAAHPGPRRPAPQPAGPVTPRPAGTPRPRPRGRRSGSRWR